MRRFVVIFACCAGFYLLLFWLFRAFTDVSELRTHYTRVVFGPGEEGARVELVGKRPPGWVSLGEVSEVARAAIVLSEDWAFWQHNGFDWDQVIDAFKDNFRQGRFARGGSTISQQVIKNVYLSNEKTLIRKAKEAVLTVRLERNVPKRRILEIYLNIAELGPGIYGVGQAARYYFQKPAAALTAKEGAFLAMLLPSPKRHGSSFRQKALTPYARATVRNILGKLLATGRIREEEYRAQLATPLSFERAAAVPLPAADPAYGEVLEEEGEPPPPEEPLEELPVQEIEEDLPLPPADV